MKVREFYDHITQHMTAEDALLKLLEGSLVKYEKLKFDKGEEVHPLLIISMAAMDLNWQMAIEKEGDDNKEVRGIAVGTDEYMKELFKQN